MSSKQIEQNQAAVNLFGDDSAFALTDAELSAIHGGTSPGGGVSHSASAASAGAGDGGGYSGADFRQDLATVGSATGIGNVIVPGGPGAAAGAGFGMGIVAQDRFHVVDHVVSFVNSVLDNEEVHRSNVI